jgi:Domain of unknown function (DUF5666)
MRRTRFGPLLALALVVGWLAPPANAQETKSARGTVTALGPSSITVKAGESNLTFAVDPKTVLTASGAGTADRAAEAAGKPGPRLSDFLKVGDNVLVGYTEAAGAMRAARIQKVNSAGSGGGSSTDAASATQNGTVTAIDGSTLTISGTGGGGSTFTQSYTVNRETKVVAVGAGTAAAAGGGGVAITSVVGVGDQVQVTYRPAGSTLHAEQVRVTAKKK